VTEAINRHEEEFSSKRLVALFAGKHPADPMRTVEDIFAAVDDFVGDAEQFDDITCVALQYLGDPQET
jgi:sigma-B regulation protein RsbU (phosphoserine phosphatase)